MTAVDERVWLTHREPPPIFDDPPCAQHDPDLFFPEHGSAHHQIDQARAICAGCPHRQPCLQFALNNMEYGIWGGTSDRERQYIRRYGPR